MKTFKLVAPDGTTYESLTPGRLGGHRRQRIYGRLDCPSAARAIGRGGYAKNRVFFADETTAIAAGFRPCASCLPKDYLLWKASPARFREEVLRRLPEA